MNAPNVKKAVTMAPAKLRNERVKVMLACTDKDSVQIFRNGLSGSRYQIVQSKSLDVDLYSALAQNMADALILQIDFPDNSLLDMLKAINAKIEIPVVMFASETRGFLVEEVVDAGVSAYVVDGLSQRRIPYILDTAIARFRSLKSIKDELHKTKTTLEERKFIDKAKGLLIKHRGISEDEAYKMLRKMAMEGNKRIGQAAEDVIRVLEALG